MRDTLRRAGYQMATMLLVMISLVTLIAPLASERVTDAATLPATAPMTPGRMLYAAQDDGTLHVYAIDARHQQTRVMRLFPCCGDVRGVAASAKTGRLYIMYNARQQGRLIALDLIAGRILWNRVAHLPAIDRGDITPDGATLYIPTGEYDTNTPYELVINARDGAAIGRIPLPIKSHDTLVSLDGAYVFMETRAPTFAMYVAATATNQIVKTISGYCCSGVLAPFAINGDHTLVVNDVVGYPGFQLASVATGLVIASVPFTGQHGFDGHGIAWTPNEREVWVNDGGNPLTHVFDMTVSPPRETHLVLVSNPSPHWITFTIDGRFAYIAGQKGKNEPTDIIDATTYQRVGAIGPSEDLVEVDFSQTSVTRVGDQFGIGRATGG